MKKIAAAAIALFTLSAGAAYAADPIMEMPVVEAPAVFDWSGFYAGVFAGGAWASFPTTSGPAVHQLATFPTISASGWLVGGQIGGDWQRRALILGIVGEGAWLGVDGTVGNADPRWDASADWYGAVSGKIGVALNRAQIYGKAGVAAVGVTLKGTDQVVNTSATVTNTQFGGLLGVGAEFAITDKVSIFTEADWIGTGATAFDLRPTGFHAVENTSVNLAVFKLGLNVHMK